MNQLKRSSLFTILSFIVLVGCREVKKMKEDADVGQKRSDSLLEEFKKVDANLQSTNAKLDSANSVLLDSLKKLK